MVTTAKRKCRHCADKYVNRPRGLCWRCHRLYRGLYPSANVAAAVVFAGRLPALPTAAPPGTEEKVRVMEGRVERGEHPHHPLDSRGEKAAVCTFPGVPARWRGYAAPRAVRLGAGLRAGAEG